MKRFLLRHGWMPGLLVAFATHAAQFKFPNQTFTVPDGFEVELVATTDLAPRPVSGSFDEQGRLYVTDSSGSNEKPDVQLTHPNHRVLRLEDTDGDGKFDKSTVFADKVMFPEGCLWYDGSVYVAAPPSIWKFTDTDGDGVADKREEWFQGKTLTGCANDLHGPYLGPDGYIYWAKGAFAEQTHVLGNGRTLKDKAAHIFRARPDGSDLDVVMSGGMDNPVEVAFAPDGEVFFTSTFIDFSQPGYRDGIGHAVYGGVFGKVHDVIEDGRVKRTSPEVMHPFYQAGPAAECALCRYESKIFGEDYRDNLFATSFNLRKVTRHILKPNGATFASTDSDFLVSDNTDFHPTDVFEDADGSLLVIDTGGWYKLCCPSSQLAKPDVLGAIYRVRKEGGRKVNDPRGEKIKWEELNPTGLTKFLDDERPWVVTRAIHQLAKSKGESIPALSKTLTESKSMDARRNAVWALTHIDDPKARRAVYAAFPTGPNSHLPLNDSAARVALYSIGLWRDANAINAPLADDVRAVEGLEAALGSRNQAIRRTAVEAFGRIGVNYYAVPRLLRIAGDHLLDPTLEHSIIYALIELNDPKLTAAGLKNSATQRTALIALDQMDNGGLKSEQVTPFLTSPDSELRKAAAWVASHHPDWGGALAGFFRERLTAKNLNDADRAELEKQLAQFAGDGAIQKLMADVLAEPATATATRQVLLHAMAGANPKAAPAAWIRPVGASLESNDETLLRSAVATARVLAQAKTAAPDFSAALLKISAIETRSTDLRLEALAALPGGVKSVEPGLLSFLCANLEPAKSVPTRSAASSVLAKAKLSEAQLLTLADTIKTTGPLEVSKLLTAFEHTTNEAVGLKLITALKESKGLSGVNPGSLKTLVAKYPPSVQEKGTELLTMLDVDEAKQKAHLDDLLATLPKGDIRGGQAVFNSPKAACTSCHKMGYVGGTVGPDLTSISQARTERDLLEAIVYPSASFVRSYEPVIVKMKDDEEYSGVLRKDAPDEVVLATGPNTEARVSRSDIAEMRPGRVSVMPGGLDEQLSKQELADLVAFLKGTKWGPN